MNPDEPNHDSGRLQNLLRQSIAPADTNTGPVRDLWPWVLHRLNEQPASHSPKWRMLDWALLAGVGVFAAFSPGWIPVLLYYL